MQVRSLLTLLLICMAIAPCASAAQPAGGDLSSSKTQVTWTGAPLLPNPVACPTATDPACDHFRLTVSSGAVKRVFVGISPEPGFEADDYDLFVYDNLGTLVASDASGDGYESVVFENTGAPYYEVRVQPWLIALGSKYRGIAMKTKEQPFDAPVAQDCEEFVPENIGLSGITDAGQRIELGVLLLLDSTTAERASYIMTKAADSYRPLGIDLVLKEMRTVNITQIMSDEIIAAAKAEVGGVPPAGIDLVGVFTNKNMQALINGVPATVVGQADCIGGIRFDNRSFFVVTDIAATETPSGTSGSGIVYTTTGLNMNVDATAETMAHEMGHLMGAHHHYANCVEGNLHSGATNDASPCTLMFNAVNGASLNFSTLSGAVVRGHAVNHAAP